jgi:hypothetical protein
MLMSSRYDLNAMFKKKFGFMTVNVQGLSRVRPVSVALSEAWRD